MIGLPEQAWQLPAIAVVLLLVIGYLLWTNRDQRKEAQAEREAAQAEREAGQEFLQSLVETNDKERQTNTKCLIDLIERTTKAQEQTAGAIASIADTLAAKLGEHERATADRHGQTMAELRTMRPGGGVAVRYPKAGGKRAE